MSETRNSRVLHQLEQTLRDRRDADAEDSYTARLIRSGETAIKRKIGEEAIEVALSQAGDKQGLRNEIADLLYHCLVLMVYNGLSLDEVLDELTRRMGASGLEEKRRRKAAP